MREKWMAASSSSDRTGPTDDPSPGIVSAADRWDPGTIRSFGTNLAARVPFAGKALVVALMLGSVGGLFALRVGAAGEASGSAEDLVPRAVRVAPEETAPAAK